ncbi:hypothetical protein SS1G_08660 [Sclerotinia sclerotiorum 1980 UF-70]|nr:hypothetical protein SS1G_08660 [Sclerotinia sclerotiorum 1980 UF-70]EDN92796.1 hypothetical protein SS1G_08660 [Sclerotinia sclerotiorum 1980 UF-70]
MDLVPLGRYVVVLETPWIKRHNPNIDWEQTSGEAGYHTIAATDPSLVGKTDAKEIPVQYRKFAKLFEDPQDLRALPEHKPWDHEINFKEGFVPPVEKLRLHNPSTLRIWEEYRSKAEKKGWIRKSKSLCAANVLLAFKKGDPNSRPC